MRGASQGKRVMDGLRLIVRELRRNAHRAERSVHITGAQLFVLQCLGDLGPCSVNALAERTMTDQSSVSVVVKRLASANLVVRKASRRDKRSVELTISPAGKRLLARCPEPMQVRMLGAIDRMTARELDGLTTGLGALVREMGIEGANAPFFFEDDQRTRSVGRSQGGTMRLSGRTRSRRSSSSR